MKSIIVLDTETTGQDPNKHEIIEIAWKLYIREDEDSEWACWKYGDYKTKPHRINSADSEALAINGYNEEDWKDAVDFNDVVPEIMADIESVDYLVGHNLIFDLYFIREECRRLYFRDPEFPEYIDTRYEGTELRKAGKLNFSPSLRTLCEHYNIEIFGREHTALVDCESTFSVFKRLSEDVEMFSFWTFDNPYSDPKYNNDFIEHKR